MSASAEGTIDERLLASLETAFATHAGADGRIDEAELAVALGLRSPALAKRMFAVFDENGDGAISRDEFVSAVRRLIAGSTRDKLSFAFRLHDEDGDGSIDEDELRRIVTLSLAEDDLSLSSADVDALTKRFFVEADTNGDRRISFDEFEKVATGHPELLAQMVRSEARWIAPNEDLLARLARDRPEDSPHARANRMRRMTFLGLWIALNVAMFASAFLRHGRGHPTWLDQLGRACTTCIQLGVGVLVLSAMRRLLTWARSKPAARVIPIDDAIDFHRFVGHSLFAFSIGHGIARLVSFTVQTKRPFVEQLLMTRDGVTGVLMISIFAVMWVCAWKVIRRTRRFELFYFTHLLYLPFLVLAVIHAPSILAWGGVAIVGLLVEHAMRLRQRGSAVEVRSATALRSGVTRLEVARPAGFAHAAGDYAFVRVPAIAGHEWHPFTISSAPEAPSLTFHVRSLGNWTAALRRRVEDGGPLTAHLDGPYGSPTRHLFESRYAVMIGAGIGVTPFASVLESIALREGPIGVLEKAHFFWLARDQSSFEWFAALLASLETKKHAERLDLHVHMTGGRPGLSAAGLEVARELLHAEGRADLVTGLQTKTHMGHPDWTAELSKIKALHAPEVVHVFFCGPEGLARTIEGICHRLAMPFREERFLVRGRKNRPNT